MIQVRAARMAFLVSIVVSLSAQSVFAQRPWAPGPGVPVTIAAGELQIEGMIYDLGPNLSEPKPALIHIHGWHPEGDHAGVDGSYYARYFSLKENIYGLAVTLRGWPNTGGVNDCGLRQPDDISKVVDWLAQQPGVDPNRIGIVGESQGGQVALLTSAINSKVKVVIAFYPLTDVTTWHEATDLEQDMIDSYVNGVCASPGTKEDRSPLFVAESINASTLFLHGDADTRVSFSQSQTMHEKLENLGKDSSLIRIEDGPHNYGAPEWDEVTTLDKVFEWLRSRL